MDAYSSVSSAYSLLGAGVGALAGMVVILFYPLLIMLAGLMLYYFTGDKKPGESIMKKLMSTSARLYAHLWMFVSGVGILIGLIMFLKGLMGLVLADFTYTTSKFATTLTARDNDIKSGLVFLTVFAIVFLFHWVFAFVVETKEEKLGTHISKIFTFLGLLWTSMMVFLGFILFVMDLLNSTSSSAVRPGGSLAILLGSVPVWGYYAFRAMMMIKAEK